MFYRHAKLFLIVLCYANLALALPNDRDQAISLAADNATFNEKTGLAVYTGNVEIKQGS
ncbi:MAG: lipopolysaccharide transport periplasmic protein LptA, partial [Pseudomonadales bacterium]|nr:lipopolysaccharide transport periplasmic protein LptA [Pseudomonadales bacterium]